MEMSLDILVLDCAGGGGIGRHAFELSKQFNRKVSSTRAIVPALSDYADKYEASEIPTDLIDTKSYLSSSKTSLLPFFMATLIQTYRTQKEANTDVIYCSHWFPSGLVSKILEPVFKHKTIIVAHGDEIYYHDKDNILKRLAKPLQKKILSSSYRVFAVSHFTKRNLKRLGVKNVRVCFNGFDPNELDSGSAKEITKNDVTPNAEKPIILTVGRLQAYKGHDQVIKALKKVKERFPDARYVIVGSGEYKEELEELTASLGLRDSVKFEGFVPDDELPGFYNACDVFVMPTRIEREGLEGFGIAYLEANAYEKPVIGTTEGGAESAIEHGSTGFLVDPYDTDEIAEHIIYILDNPKLSKRLGREGKQRVLESFTWEDVSERILEEI